MDENDGIHFVNVYSRGVTDLGKFLSNFSYSPINTEDGNFKSIEGYWYYLGTDNPEREKLRDLFGYRAKEFGRILKSKDWQDSDEFKRKIKTAITIKLNNNPKFKEQLSNLKLPLKHFYVMYGKVIEPKDGKWILEHLESFKK